MENNNEFFGVDEKYIPKSENNDKEYIKNDEKNIYEPENVNVEYTKKDKKKFNAVLILLLVGIPIIIFIIILIIMISIIGKNVSKEVVEIPKATSRLHQDLRDIYESSSDVVEDAAEKISVQEKEMFNSKFTAYEGIQRGGNVKALITAVTASNSVGVRQVSLKGVTAITDVISQTNYNVIINYDSEGCVNEIVIKEAE